MVPHPREDMAPRQLEDMDPRVGDTVDRLEEDMGHHHQQEVHTAHRHILADLRHRAAIVDHHLVLILNCGIGSLPSTTTDLVRLTLQNSNAL